MYLKVSRKSGFARDKRPVDVLLGVGEGDESWLGPSWSNGKLYFYDDSMGAGFTIYRFDPARGTYASAPAFTYLTASRSSATVPTRRPLRATRGSATLALKTNHACCG